MEAEIAVGLRRVAAAEGELPTPPPLLRTREVPRSMRREAVAVLAGGTEVLVRAAPGSEFRRGLPVGPVC